MVLIICTSRKPSVTPIAPAICPPITIAGINRNVLNTLNLKLISTRAFAISSEPIGLPTERSSPTTIQQLQHRNNAVPLLTKDQRYKVIRHHHQPEQRRKVDNPHHRQQLVEVHAQLFGVVLNFGKRRK